MGNIIWVVEVTWLTGGLPYLWIDATYLKCIGVNYPPVSPYWDNSTWN